MCSYFNYEQDYPEEPLVTITETEPNEEENEKNKEKVKKKQERQEKYDIWHNNMMKCICNYEDLINWTKTLIIMIEVNKKTLYEKIGLLMMVKYNQQIK